MLSNWALGDTSQLEKKFELKNPALPWGCNPLETLPYWETLSRTIKTR
jgi:hypothetical protein